MFQHLLRRLRSAASALVSTPRMLALRVRYARPIAFVRARLSPDSYLGLQLTLGALVLTGFGWLFGGIAEDVATGDPLTVVDLLIAQWFQGHRDPALTHTMLVITHLHGVPAISILVGLAGLALAWKRDWHWLLLLALTVPGGMLVNALTKLAFQRDRPSDEHPLLVLATSSFPSGHVAGATLFYGFLVAFYAARPGRRSRKVSAVVAATTIVALVAISRMTLGVHYLSDVLAAFAESVAWLTLCVIGTRTYWQLRAAAHDAGG